MAQTDSNTTMKNRPEYAARKPSWTIIGFERKPLSDLYYYLIAASWGSLLGLAFGGYVLINLFFAALYYFDLEGVANAQPGSFSDAFFFSVQTFSTIGFGAMSPQSPYTHVLVTIESFAGLIADESSIDDLLTKLWNGDLKNLFIFDEFDEFESFSLFSDFSDLC